MTGLKYGHEWRVRIRAWDDGRVVARSGAREEYRGNVSADHPDQKGRYQRVSSKGAIRRPGQPDDETEEHREPEHVASVDEPNYAAIVDERLQPLPGMAPEMQPAIEPGEPGIPRVAVHVVYHLLDAVERTLDRWRDQTYEQGSRNRLEGPHARLECEPAGGDREKQRGERRIRPPDHPVPLQARREHEGRHTGDVNPCEDE